MSAHNLAQTVLENGRSKHNKCSTQQKNRLFRRSTRQALAGMRDPASDFDDGHELPMENPSRPDSWYKINPTRRWLYQFVGKTEMEIECEIHARLPEAKGEGRRVLKHLLLKTRRAPSNKAWNLDSDNRIDLHLPSMSKSRNTAPYRVRDGRLVNLDIENPKPVNPSGTGRLKRKESQLKRQAKRAADLEALTEREKLIQKALRRPHLTRKQELRQERRNAKHRARMDAWLKEKATARTITLRKAA